MQDFSRVYDVDTNGFEGSIECYLVDTHQENLKNWLEREVGDSGNIYNAFKKSTKDVLVIKNLFLESEYRGHGFGVKAFEEILKESNASSAVLVCDVFESQKPGFDLASHSVNELTELTNGLFAAQVDSGPELVPSQVPEQHVLGSSFPKIGWNRP